MKREVREEKGITLVGLVVTIVVLLILAGITLGNVFGDGGSIKLTQDQKNRIEEEIASKQEEIAGLENQLKEEQIDKKPPPVEASTEMYAFLYTDGTLSIGSKEEAISYKTVSKAYGNIVGKTQIVVENNTTIWQRPWIDDATSITTVIFKEQVAPTFTAGWFYGCTNLTNIQKIENFRTDKITDMRNMFCNCSNLESLNVSKFNTENVTNMQSLFYNCGKLTSLNVSNFNTDKVTNMFAMFYNCTNLTNLDVSNFNTENVTNMTRMFQLCSNLTSLDLSGFNTVNVTDMRYMFSNCSSLANLDVSSFDTAKVTGMNYMFSRCSKLTTIYVGVNWKIGQSTNTVNMFLDCGTDQLTLK